MGDTWYVPWAEGGNWGTGSQVTVFGDWDEKPDVGDWSVISRGSNGQGGEKGKKRKKRKRMKEGGTFWVPGELLFRTREEAQAHLRAAYDGDDRDDGDDEGDRGDDNGEGGDKGAGKEGDTGGEKGGVGSKDAPRQPPTTQEG